MKRNMFSNYQNEQKYFGKFYAFRFYEHIIAEVKQTYQPSYAPSMKTFW